jgi:FeS assembly SUF system regulator
MIKITRLTDYAIVLLSFYARSPMQSLQNARDLAMQTHLPLPTVSKVLKVLAKKGLLIAQRGAKGGFRLSRQPEEITVASIVDAVEGHTGITECSFAEPGACELEQLCPVQTNWKKISRVVWGAFDKLTLTDMTKPLRFEFLHEEPQVKILGDFREGKAQ